MRIHPVHLIDPETFAVVDLWFACQSAMGPGPLPCAGGLLDQPACLMAAFDVCAGAREALRPRLKAEGAR